jgi:hypothetical protein
VGAAGGPIASVPSALVRGKRLSIFGYSNFGLRPDQVRAAYGQLLAGVQDGTVRLPVVSVPLADIGSAWAGLRRGDGKYVVRMDS